MTKESLQERIDAAVARTAIPPETSDEARALAETVRRRLQDVRSGKVSKRQAPCVEAAAVYLLAEITNSEELAQLAETAIERVGGDPSGAPATARSTKSRRRTP